MADKDLKQFMKPKGTGYADKNYLQKRELYDCVAQAFENVKYGVHSAGHTWNTPVEEITGTTMRLLPDLHLEITYHHYEVTTQEGLVRDAKDGDGAKFVKEVEKQLKKEFKKLTKKTLKMKKVREDRAIDKASRMQADSSWMLGSSRYGHGARPVGRYLIKDSVVYSFDAKIERY